jgi:hypothetical protein
MTLLIELEQFIAAHRPHGRIEGDADPLTEAGYRVWLQCACGVRFEPVGERAGRRAGRGELELTEARQAGSRRRDPSVTRP